MKFANKPVIIKLGGEDRKLYFDLNTFSAFEEVSGKFFLDFLANVRDAVKDSRASGDAMMILRRVSVKDVRAFIWAALHEYDSKDDPQWPMTLNQLGRMIDLSSIPTLLPAIMQGNAENGPEVDSEEEGEDRPTMQAKPVPVNGGAQSTVSDEDALALLERDSEK